MAQNSVGPESTEIDNDPLALFCQCDRRDRSLRRRIHCRLSTQETSVISPFLIGIVQTREAQRRSRVLRDVFRAPIVRTALLTARDGRRLAICFPPTRRLRAASHLAIVFRQRPSPVNIFPSIPGQQFWCRTICVIEWVAWIDETISSCNEGSES